MLPTQNPSETASWKALEAHYSANEINAYA